MVAVIVISAVIIAVSVAVAGVVGLRAVRDSRQALRESRDIVHNISVHCGQLREEGRLISASFARLTEAVARRGEAIAGVEELKTAGSNLSHVAGLVRAVLSVKRAVSVGAPTALGVALFNAFYSTKEDDL